MTRIKPVSPRRRAQAGLAPIVVAAALIVAGGVAYRAIFARLNKSADRVVFPRGTLELLPKQWGPWLGEDRPVEDRIFEAADIDDCVQRIYSQPGGQNRVALYVAAGVRARDLVPHRPEVCYTTHGWTMQRTDDVQVPRENKRPIDARLLYFKPSGLSEEHLVVLNYYFIDGDSYPDVAKLREKASGFKADLRYMAQIQITRSYSGSDGAKDATDVVTQFAALTAEHIRDVLEDESEKHSAKAPAAATN